jgi:hypothetical protein
MRELQYPIGEFSAPQVISDEQASAWIDEIEALPQAVSDVVCTLTDEQLDTPYRPGGWSVRQVVHHMGDSHLNSLVRFKWALTEDRPTIKAYDEAGWALLPDYKLVPLDVGLEFLRLLHVRWVVLLRALGPDDLARTFVHPDSGQVPLRTNVGVYAWHGRHHLAHITRLVEREGW